MAIPGLHVALAVDAVDSTDSACRVENELWQVVVVGAGAAGLVAALRAAERGKRVLVLEKNARPGVKILMSGGTRCNITQACDNQGIVKAFGKQGVFLHSALAALGVEASVQMFNDEGVATKVESTGKIFPVSDRATDVLDALLRRLDRSGATLACSEPLQTIAVESPASVNSRLTLSTPRRSIIAEKVIVTSGGQSYPGSGTTGDGYAWAASLGHTIAPLRPALTPVSTSDAWVKTLSGVTIPDVTVRVVETSPPDVASSAKHAGTCLAEARGSFLFTHFGLSGPVALDVSRAVSGHDRPTSLVLECDFLPAISEAAMAEEFKSKSATAGRRLLASILPAELPQRLHAALAANAGVRLDRKAAELTKQERAALVAAYKRQRIAVAGTRGFKQAEVTAGGVILEEVDSRTMQSKLVPNLFFAGEVLDLDGPIGGYNFQAAWSTGWLAGSSV